MKRTLHLTIKNKITMAIENYLYKSPVEQISLGSAVQITLDNYYDLLKKQSGNLGANEYLQLKISCDALDISESVDMGSYKFFSYYNMLQRCDLTIDPTPVNGELLSSAIRLTELYGRFLSKLISLVEFKPLTKEQQAEVDNINTAIQKNKDIASALIDKELQDWNKYCLLKGVNPADVLHYNQWAKNFGQITQIRDLFDDNNKKRIKKKKILDSILNDPAEQIIIDAVNDFESPSMYLRYPMFPDYEYIPTVLSLQFLSQLPNGATALFDDRRVIGFDKTLTHIKTAKAGSINAELSKETGESKTIETDWGVSTSARKFLFSVKIDASSHTKIQEEFNNVTSLAIKNEATIVVGINYGEWFKPSLFEHPKVSANAALFQEFFGNNGSLLYYPTKMVLIRGFSATFTNTNEWQYDYENTFKVGGGGGFGAFGINFGLSGNYSQNTKEHKFEKNGTKLSMKDDESTVRFVGYIVKKNDALKEPAEASITNLINELDFVE